MNVLHESHSSHAYGDLHTSNGESENQRSEKCSGWLVLIVLIVLVFLLSAGMSNPAMLSDVCDIEN
jgi:hypothetical protein